jgi:hypothetical protein
MLNCVTGVKLSGKFGSLDISDNSFVGAAATGTNIKLINTGATEANKGFGIKGNRFEGGVAGQKYVHFNDVTTGVAAYQALDIEGNVFDGVAVDAVVLENCAGSSVRANDFNQTTAGGGHPVQVSATCLKTDIGVNILGTAPVSYLCPVEEISTWPYA